MNDNYFISAIIALIIWAIALYSIISSASRGKEIAATQRAQLSILIEIAFKAGVSADRIDKILGDNFSTQDSTPKKKGRFW